MGGYITASSSTQSPSFTSHMNIHNQSTMGPGQLFQDNPHAINNPRVVDGGATSTGYITDLSPQTMDNSGPQQRVPHRSTTNYTSEASASQLASNLYMPSFRGEENGETSHSGSTSLCSPSPATSHLYSPGSAVETTDQSSVLGGWQRVHDGVANPDERTFRFMVPPERAGEYPYDHLAGRQLCSPYEQSGFRRAEFSYTEHSGWSRSADSRGVPPRFDDHTSVSGFGRHESRSPATDGHPDPVPIPHLLYNNGQELYSYTTMDHTTPAQGGSPSRERWSHRYDPYVRPYHSRPRSNTPTFTGSGDGRTNTTERPGPCDPHRLDDIGTGDMGHLAAGPLNPHSGRTSNRPTGVQRSRRGKGARRTTSQDNAAPVRKRTPRGKPADPQDSTARSQLPATPTTTLVPTHFIKVPQEKYRCATDQGDWEEAAPIDFGGIKLTDAANKSYHGLHGHDDEVLDYNGVGSTILCRLTFSGAGTEKWNEKKKILTKNSRNPPEQITKRKLALEVSKHVERHISTIKAEPDCAGATFENMVLVKLFHVSRGSWQPELWYAASPSPNPS